MGFLDFLGKGSIKKHVTRVANKRAHAPDRWESIHALGKDGSAEALAALVQRFTFRVDPGITDQEEKDVAYRYIVNAGEPAIEAVRSFLRSHSSVAWPVKMLSALVSEEDVTQELLDLLEKMDTEYERDPQKKVDTLAIFEERFDPRVSEAVSPFLEDVSESARFHAVGALLAQPDGLSEDDLKSRLDSVIAGEESMRVKARMLDAFMERGWKVKSADKVSKQLPVGYSISKNGEVQK